MTSLNQNTGLPSDLDFKMKQGAPRGVRCFRTQLAPIGGISTSGATNGDTLKWDIPVGRKGQYINPLETYLQIRVRNVGTGDIVLDGSAFCFFNRFQVLSSGAIVEDIQEYSAFCNAQIDAGIGPTIRQTASNIMMGTGSDSANLTNTVRAGNTITAGTYQNYTLPLISGILGAQGSTKYLPVGAVSTDLRCEITLHQTQQAAVVGLTAAPGIWSIVEANLMLSYVEVDSDVQNMIDGASGGNYYISTETWRNYGNNIGSGSMGDTILIPAKFSSVKGMIHTFRPIAGLNSYLYAGQSHRVNPFFSATANCSVQYSIGSAYFPSTPIRSAQELFVELQRYYHNLSNPNITGVINNANFTINTDPAVLTNASTAGNVSSYFTNSGTGLIGINLDQISNRSDVMASGISTLNSNIIANFTYATAYTNTLPAGNAGMRLDTFVHLDMVLVIENGVLTIRT